MSPVAQPIEKHVFKEGSFVSRAGVKFCDVPGCGQPMSAAVHHLFDNGDDTSLPEGLPRFTRDNMLIAIAEIVRRRSTCNRGQVGVVIAHNGRIASMGYNGSPPGAPHCCDEGVDCDELTLFEQTGTTPDHLKYTAVELGCQRTIHAEANAIAWAARTGVPVAGATMYSTHSPCGTCAKLIVSAGIAGFVYVRSYRAERLDTLAQGNVKVIKTGEV